jgi:hypothetical protein
VRYEGTGSNGKSVGKMRELSGRPFLSEDEITISITVDVELDETQYEELTKMLKSMGYKFYKRGLMNWGLQWLSIVMTVQANMCL